MKSIKLTKKQKQRLVEMINILYQPKYGEVQLLKSYCSTPTDLTGSPYLRWYKLNQKKNTWSKEPNIQLIEIHWFEFCCTHLLEDLIVTQFNGITDDVVFEGTKASYFEDISLNEICPVDWLYNFYKLIPKGQGLMKSYNLGKKTTGAWYKKFLINYFK